MEKIINKKGETKMNYTEKQINKISYKNYEGEEKKPLTVGQLKQLLEGCKDTEQVVIHTTSEQGDEPLVLENQITRVNKEQGLWTVDVAVIYTLD